MSGQAGSANGDEMMGRTRIEPVLPDPLFEKWEHWARELEAQVVRGLFIRRATWRGLTEIWDSNKSIPGSLVFEYFGTTYADSQSVFVRRLIDELKQTRSLVRLLRSMASRPRLLSRQRIVGAYPWGTQSIGDRMFSNLAGEDAWYVPASVIAADVHRLTSECAPIKVHADKVIAHMDRVPPATQATFDELHHAIETIGEVFQTWATLLLGYTPMLVPVPQYDWAEPFRMAWLSDTDRSPPFAV